MSKKVKSKYTPEEIRAMRAKLGINEAVAEATASVSQLESDRCGAMTRVACKDDQRALTEANRQYR